MLRCALAYKQALWRAMQGPMNGLWHCAVAHERRHGEPRRGAASRRDLLPLRPRALAGMPYPTPYLIPYFVLPPALSGALPLFFVCYMPAVLFLLKHHDNTRAAQPCGCKQA